VYLFISWNTHRLGFPLDDAWIHQSYARNLAQDGQWGLVPGQPSAGSTAPLWSALLTLGYSFDIEPRWWAYGLGWLSLLGLTLVGVWGVRMIASGYQPWATVAAGVFLFEWHLVWAAVSGMETVLIALLVTAVLIWITNVRVNWFWIGVLIGLSVWIRPDGITLLGPAGLISLLRGNKTEARPRALITLVSGFLLLFGPYLVFNWGLAGDWWPNTFYAKQAEYEELRAAPLILRFLALLKVQIIGVASVLAPGVIYLLLQSFKERKWEILAGMVWWLGYVGLYAWRLPVTYQHGRYLIPAVPIFLVWGVSGMMKWLSVAKDGLGPRVVGRAWVVTVSVILLVFWGLGARAYARDVAFIETEMVEMAQWIDAHTPQDSLIAVHDIGAIGYFGQRELVDLAGLISPDVIPFIRDQGRLAQYMDRRGVDYLVTFPGWYPDLTADLPLLYRTRGEYGPENMAVYRWE
jgi:hypothetical protein